MPMLPGLVPSHDNANELSTVAGASGRKQVDFPPDRPGWPNPAHRTKHAHPFPLDSTDNMLDRQAKPLAIDA